MGEGTDNILSMISATSKNIKKLKKELVDNNDKLSNATYQFFTAEMKKELDDRGILFDKSLGMGGYLFRFKDHLKAYIYLETGEDGFELYVSEESWNKIVIGYEDFDVRSFITSIQELKIKFIENQIKKRGDILNEF